MDIDSLYEYLNFDIKVQYTNSTSTLVQFHECNELDIERWYNLDIGNSDGLQNWFYEKSIYSRTRNFKGKLMCLDHPNQLHIGTHNDETNSFLVFKIEYDRSMDTRLIDQILDSEMALTYFQRSHAYIANEFGQETTKPIV